MDYQCDQLSKNLIQAQIHENIQFSKDEISKTSVVDFSSLWLCLIVENSVHNFVLLIDARYITDFVKWKIRLLNKIKLIWRIFAAMYKFSWNWVWLHDSCTPKWCDVWRHILRLQYFVWGWWMVVPATNYVGLPKSMKISGKQDKYCMKSF